jgi:hypothetical protein
MARSTFKYLIIYEDETTKMVKATTVYDVLEKEEYDDEIHSIINMGLDW